MSETNIAPAQVKRTAPAVIPVEVHQWLRREAFERDSTITAQIVEAVELLRRQREMDEQPKVRQ